MFFRKPRLDEIDVNNAKQLLDNPDIVWLDVREIIEHNQLRLPNSTLIPMGLLPLRESELRDVLDKEIIVYCRTGSRSYHATRWLNDRGYNAKNMVGGIMQWSRFDHPTIQGAV